MLRDAFARHGGVEVDTQGDAFFVAFARASGALAAAAEARLASCADFVGATSTATTARLPVASIRLVFHSARRKS